MAKEILNLEVKSNIESVTKETDKLGKSLGKSVDETKDLDKGLEDAGESGKKGFQSISGAVNGLGIALKAAGIGLVIALFASLSEAFKRNQTVMDIFTTTMTTVSTTFNQLVQALINIVSWVTASQDRFDGLGKVLSSLVTLQLTPLKLAFFRIKLAVQGLMLAWEASFLGGGDEGKIAELRADVLGTAEDIKEVGLAALKAGKDIYENVGDAITEIGSIGEMVIDQISQISIKANYEMAKATTAATNASRLAEIQIQGLIEKYDRQAELQRQIRDDERKTFAERKTANDEIAKILEKQEKEMMALADTRVAAALLERNNNADNLEFEIAYQATLNDRAGVLAQIAGFTSEQIVNEATLEKELAETKKQIAAELLEGQDRELLELEQAYELKLEMARKAGVNNLKITEKYLKEKKAIEDAAAEEDKARDKKKLDMELAFANQGLQIIGDAAGEGTALAKAAAIAQATMSGIQGVQNAFTAANANIGATVGSFGAYPLTMASLAGIFAAANIAKIASGSPATGDMPDSPSTVVPSPQMMSGAFELTGGQASQPLQAYVVSDDITNSQNALAIIRRRATI